MKTGIEFIKMQEQKVFEMDQYIINNIDPDDKRLFLQATALLVAEITTLRHAKILNKT